jgi:N-acetylneuraminic acid mutarotase
MVWDQEMGKFVLFGGVSSTGFHSGTWAFDPVSGTWSKLATTGSPPPRAGAGMAAEPNGDIVLFGGLTYTGFLADTWVFDPSTNTWAEQHPPASPPARFEPAMAADSSTGTVVLFGGLGVGGYYGGTWAYTDGAWARLTPGGTPPSARYGAGLAYDSAAGDFVLVDGDSAPGYSGATYTYDPTTSTWAVLAPTTSPSPRAGAGFSYDPAAGTFVQFGGFNGSTFLADTWELAG